PKQVIDAFDAQPLPAVLLSPSKQVIALTYRRAYPTIAELAQPMLRLAGARISPQRNGPHRTANIYAITLKKVSDGSEMKSAVPLGPNVQETSGKAAPAATFEDMLKTAHDDALFEYYFTSQLAAIDAATGRKSLIGKPAIFDSVTPSPGGEFLLVTKIKRPF